jgi:hypothetical protein
MHKRALAIVALTFSACSTATGGADPPPAAYARPHGAVYQVVRPIFSQLLVVSYPQEFKPTYENASPDQYVLEATPGGDPKARWEQMITVTGARGKAEDPKARPDILLANMAGNMRRNCPHTFSAKGLGVGKVSGHDAFAALMGCGSVQSSGYQHSESTLVIALKGQADFYTVQWAERGAPSDKPPVFQQAKWMGRVRQLAPIKLCARSEGPPYEHCFAQQ